MVTANSLRNDGLEGKSRIRLQIRRSTIARCILAACIIVGLSACSDEATVELQEYIADVKSRQKSRIPPLPKPQEFEVFTYNDSTTRNPFEPTVEIQAMESNNGLRPDMSRARDVLEQYALGSLKMMGSLEKNGQLWALIRSSDGTLYRTTIGKHLGKNNGRITKITETEIELREIVPDGLGGWIERTSTLVASE
ncbi:MAG: pilus assembly protein PilP [Gammaproteobacteria bacterium]|nr:pilus assembly protein PilP [Gammaproteobacteria bacterium]